MRISSKGRYGTRALLELALHYGEAPILVKDIARSQQMSERYLEQLLIMLKVAGMVRSIRGARGGFTLARPPEEIKLSEIIQVMEGSIAPAECVDDSRLCQRASLCVTRDVWVKVQSATDSVLQSTTLQNLVELQTEKEARATVARS